MPLYKLNGKTYNIPDDVVSNFEKDNPDATIGYSVGDKKYEIPVSKRDGFLQAYPKAVLTGLEQPSVEQTKEANENATKTTPTYTFSQAQLDSMERADRNMPQGDTVSQQVQQHNMNTYGLTNPTDKEKEMIMAEREIEEKAKQRDAELQEAYAERERLEKELEPYTRRQASRIIHSSTIPGGYAGGYSAEESGDMERHDALLSAKRQLDERIGTLEESRDKNTSGFWRNLWRTVTNPSTWSFGLIPLNDALVANDVANKLKNDTELNEQEETMLQQMVMNEEAKQKYGNDNGFMARAGTITGEALPFVAEFLLTGGYSGVANGVGSATTKGLAKMTATDLSKKGLRSWLVKSTGTVAGDVAGATLMANTTGAAKTASDAMERHRGSIIQDDNGDYHFGHYEQDEDGNPVFVDGGKTWAQSIYEAEAANTLEYYTEMLGTHMEKPLGAAGSWIAEKAGLDKAGAYMVKKLGLGEVSKDLSQVTANGYGRAMKHVLERGGIQDYPSEVLEEEANIILNSMFVGDNSLSDLVDGRTQADIWGGMLFSVGFMNSPAVAGGTVDAASYLRTKHSMDNAERLASYRMTEDRWKPLRERIDGTSNEDFADLANEILADEDMHIEEKKAVLKYMGQLAKFRGFNVGSSAKAKDEVENPSGEQQGTVSRDLNTSYIGGYEANDEQLNDIKNGYEFQRQRLSAIVDDDYLQSFDNDPVNTLVGILSDGNSWTDEEKQTAIDYVNAKAAYDGMIHRVQDDIDGRIAMSDAMIESRQHHDDGMIHPATMKTDDRKVYVIGGKLVMNEDGTMIDYDQSDESVIIRDAATGAIEFADPRDVLSTDETIDAAQEKQIAQEAIRQQYAQEAANKIDGVLPFNNGDTYQVVDDQGQQHTVTVVAPAEGPGVNGANGQNVTAGDGEVVVSIDGAEPVPMSREAIQQMAENANLARLQQYEQEQAAHREEQAAAEREANRPVYNINDEVTLQTEEGTVRGSITAEANEDGQYEVYTEEPINGKKINLFTRDELDNMLIEHNGNVAPQVQPTENESAVLPQGTTENGAGLDNAGGEAGAANGTGANNPPATALSRIPILRDEKGQPILNKKGKPTYQWHEAPVADTADALTEQAGGAMLTARDVATDMVGKAKEQLEKVRKQKPKGEDPIELIESRNAIQQAEQQAQDIVKYWQDVNQEIQRRMREDSARRQAEAEAAKSEAQRLREAEEKRQQEERQNEIERQRLREAIEKDHERRNREYEPMTKARKEMANDPDALGILDDTEPRDLEEWVSSLLLPHSILWQDASENEVGLRSELGLKRGDMQRFMNLLGTKENGAKPFGKVVLDIYEGLPESMKEQYTDQDVRNTLLELFNEGSSGRMMNLTKEHRIEEARAVMKENMRRDAEAEMEAWEEAYHLTAEERATFEDYMQQPPTAVDEEIINQIIADNEQNRRSEEVDREPVGQGEESEVRGSTGEVSGQGATEKTGGNNEPAEQQHGQIQSDHAFVSGDDVAGREQTLAERVVVNDDDWTEDSDDGIVYKRTITIDDAHSVTQVDEPNDKGDYTGSYFLYEGKRFGGLPEVIAYIDESAQLGDTSSADEIAAEEAKVDTEPSEAQKEAGNYRKGHISIDGYDITIENPKGSVRSGTDGNGNHWETTMHNTYGYIRGTEGVDGDHIDVFLSDNPTVGNVFVVDQVNTDGSFDEHKVMYGFASEEEARKAYLSNYSKGWKGLGAITEVSREEFKKWVESSHRKTKPFAEYKSVKPTEGQNEQRDPRYNEGWDGDYSKWKARRDYLDEIERKEKAAAEQGRKAYYISATDGNGQRNGVFHKVWLKPEEAETGYYAGHMLWTQQEAYRTEEGFQLGNIYYSGEELTGKPAADAAGTVAGGEKPYTITPTTYTNKKGKETPMFLVKFGSGLTKEQIRAGKELARESKGWWDREQGGFMMRSEDAANELAEALSNEDAVQDAQPVSITEMAALVESEPAKEPEEKSSGTVASEQKQQQEQVSEQKPKSKWVDDEDAARFEELKERLRKKMLGQLNMGVDPEIFYLGTQMAFMIVKHGARKFSEYAKAMIDEMGDGIRKQLKTFYNGARDMMEASDNEQENEIARDMDDYDTVKKFDVLSIGNETSRPTVFEKAEQVTGEQEAEQQQAVAEEKMKEQRNDGRKAQEEGVALDGTPLRAMTAADLDENFPTYYEGRRVVIMLVVRSGEQVSATQFSEPKIDYIMLTNGKTVQLNDLMVADSEKPQSKETIEARKARWQGEAKKKTEQKSKKTFSSKKKDVSLQQRDLFADVELNNNNNETRNREDSQREKGGRTGAYAQENGDIRRERTSQEEGNRSERRTDSSRSQGREDKRVSSGIPQGESERTGNDVGERLDAGVQERRNDGRGNSSVPSGAEQVRSSIGRSSGRISRLDPEKAERPANPKNTHNNHGERGKDYAPRGVDARIDANIKAIELMQQLIESGEQATPEQMAVLRQFSGWGGLGKAFNPDGYQGGYRPDGTPARLRALLGEEAYQQAVMSRNSAYYTPATVIDSMWDIARAMGFQGGNVLEGSAGIGNIIGQMPVDLSERSNIQAVEIDQTTGNILSLLYPDAKVDIQGFEKTQVENGSIDLAITNVPFVTGLRVNDTTGDKDLSKKFHDIHDFCIAKNIRKLKEGGIGIFISSSGTLDNSARLREWMIQEGGVDVVGAFRLNNETFGGTGATSDIIVVRKRVNGKKSPYAIDVLGTSGERTAEYDTGDVKKVKGEYVPVMKQLPMDYNQYFIEHPEMMAGKMYFGFEKGDTFRPTSKALYPVQGKNQEKMLTEWAQSFAETDWEEVATVSQQTEHSSVYDELGKDVKEGSMVVDKKGNLCIAQRGKAVPLAVNANKVKGYTKVECFEAYQKIKQALAELLDYQTNNESDADLQPKLKALNKAYDDFVKTYGYLHKNTAISFLKSDVDFANILALETYKELGDGKGGVEKTYSKTDIFSKRVVDKEKSPEPKNVKDGIIASIYLHGRVDVPYISEQIGMSEAEVKNEIIKQGLGFENPSTRQMEVSYEYLSGNVREKLRQARENNSDGRYDANIKALEKIIPMNIPAHLIDFSIGSSWIDPKLYEEFVKDKTDIDVTFTAAGGTWYMKTPAYVGEQKNRAMGVTSEMLHKTIMGTQLIEAAMQNKTITVSETRKKWDGTTETITDKEATQACSNKIDEIRQEFKDWARDKMKSDPEMSERIERIYNEQFNNYVPLSIDDAFVPEHFAGASKKITLDPHQSHAALRAVMQPVLLAHEVGAGKTFTLITTAMEMRRLGTARKPMIVVQNATVGQFVESAKELYPNAKVLTIEEADRTTEGRKNFYAKIKYNDWDMIVVPQSVFERIPDSEERQMKFVQDKIEEKLLVLEQMKDADPSGNSMIVKQAEKEIDKLRDDLAGLTDTISSKRKERDEKKAAVTRQNAEVKALEMLDRATDDVENFDDMGIDAILVDEAHEYKHLGFATAMQRGVKGVDPSYSKKAQGVYLKTQAVLEKNNGRNVVFATGTPISNTAAEIWTFMRYLMPADTMKEYGIYYFDDFVRNFGNLQQMLEFTTSGKFKEVNRFAGYVNLPELARIWASIADIMTQKEIEDYRKKIGRPTKLPYTELGEDKAQDIYLPQTKALRSVMKYVKARLKEYDEMSGKEKKENSHIPLTMYGIAKAAAVDARLVVSDAADEPQSKTNEAVRQTLKSLEDTKDYSGTVAIFADNYQNKKSGFNLYEDIRKKLIEAGVPAEQIVVMKSGMSVKKKLEIFDKVNRGEVRVILGSTFTLGTGVNIQERLHTLIHLDAPNRPMDYTQRNGRIIRQGNMHKKWDKPVRVLRFGVEDSLDVTAYQRLKTKGAIADSIMKSKDMMQNSMENRALEEEEDVFGDTVAQLSGSEYAMLKNQAEKDVRKYESKKKQYEADQAYCHNEIPRLEGQIKEIKRRIEDNKKNLATVEAMPKEKVITVGKQTFKSVDEMEDFIKEHNKKIKEVENDLRDNPSTQSSFRELTVNVGGLDFKIKTEQFVETKEGNGTLFTAVHRRMTYDCDALGLEDVPVSRSMLAEALNDIMNNVVTGNDFKERIEYAERSLSNLEKQLSQVKERYGKPFEYTKELENAHERYDECAELMKKELEDKEKKYAEMDAEVEDIDDVTEAEEADDETEDEDSDVHFRDGEDDVESINEQFNKELQMQIDGTLPQGHIYDMGMPSDILLSTGIANVPIQLNSTRLESKSSQFGHDFALSEIKDLVKAINDPVAIFAYGDKEKAQNIIVEIQKEGNNFVVGLSIRPSVNGRVLEVNSIRNVFPKKNAEWLNWINQGKLLYVDKEKIQNLINQQRTILADVEYLDLDSAAKVVENFENPKLSEENLRFRIREDVPPRKTGIGYKVFVLKDGQLYPPMVANPDGAATPTGVWLDADAAPVAGMSKTGRAQVKAGGKGTQGGSGTLAYRPGWHLGTIPYALQFNRKNPETGERDLFPANFVWAEVEYANDVDYQQEAHDAGVNANGKYQHSLAGLKRVPVNGSYMYRTNPNPETDPWIITGAMKVKRILKPSEVDAMVKAAGREPQQRQDGYITDTEIEALNKEIDTHEREGEATKRLTDEESLAMSRRAGYTKKQHDAWQERAWRHMHEAAESTVERLGLGGRVTIMETPDGLKGRKAKAKGWFDAKTGKIVVVLGNHHSVSDVVKTILHEGVAHYGLRKLFGQHFDQFLDNVYQYGDESVRREIVELAKKHGWDFREATEEYLARLAEDTDFERATNQGWWSKIKSLFLDMLHHIGLGDYGGAILTNNELRYILWRSYENMAEPGRYRNPFREAEDISMQMRLGVGSFDRERARIHSLGRIDNSRAVAAEAATMSQRTGQGVLFRDGDFSERDRATARNAYEEMVSSGLYQFQEAVQDSMLGLKKLYDAILNPKGKVHMEDVEGYENAYLAENRMSSVNAAEQHDYYLRFMQPLLKAIGSIAGNKKGARQALTDYMMAKHGLERNRVLAERDAREVEANGGDFNKAYQKFREKDYSGLTALTGEDDVAAAEAAAQKIVDDYEAAYDTADLWDRTREATQATLEKIYRSGLLSKERYEQIRDMFEYYIPLQGWDETTSDEVYGYLTSKSGPFGGSPIKHAVGRSSKADDPIATIAMMADAAIRQGNRNLMKQRFLNFVLNHPSDLVSVHDLWLEYDAATDEWIPVFADLEDGDTAADVERKVEAFEQRMEQLAEAEPDRYKRGREAQGIPYKVVKGNLKEHQVLVKRGGRTYVLTINGNPRAAQALNGLTNPDVEQGGVVGNMLKAGEWVNRHLSAFYTTRNPDFVVSNFFRDMLYSNCMTWVKESPRYALRYHKNFGMVANPVMMRRLLGKWEKGTLDMSNRLEKMFYQFMMNGGETGYTSVRDIEEHKREIAKELKKQGSMSRKAWSALGMQLDLLNRSVENCARFAAFVTSREMGRSIDRSIYDAKEVSVNFNKKGSGGKMVNATGQTRLGKVGSYVGGGGRLAYVFWNAGVQGLTNFGRAGKRHGGKAFAGAATMFILGYVIPQLAAAMGGGDGDDDDKNAYYNLPEYVRRSNICFRVGDQWVTIPLPIEFRSIYGLGELASGAISGNEHYDNKELSYQIASQVSQILPLDMLEGGGGVSPWIPSTMKPFTEAYVMNKGWTGLPIYKDTPWNQNAPEWTKAYKNADQSLVGASKWLNEKTGGDDFKKGAIDINPAKLEYLLSGVFGGYVNTAEKLKKMGETALGNREFDWRNMLLANRVVKTGDERTANRKLQNEYFKYKKEYDEAKRLMRKYEDAADEGVAGMAEKVDFLYNSPEYLRYELFDEYKADIDDYREDLQEATDDAERKEIEAEMYATMRELIDQLHEIK